MTETEEREQRTGQIPNTGVAAASRDQVDHTLEKELNQREREPRKPAARILAQEIIEGLGEIERSTTGLVMAGLNAGLDLGFSVFLMATVLTLVKDTLPGPITELLVAVAYTFGYIIVVIGRSELFTEHTTLAVLPVLYGRTSVPQLLRLWGIILATNILGGAIFAFLAVNIGPSLGIIEPATFGDLARGVVGHSGMVILFSGIMAGWLMGLLSWLVAAARETVSQILIIFAITFTIGLAHLHHAIAGTIEVLAGLMAGQGITLSDYLHFLVWTTLGNSIGGVFFVAVLKYGHVFKSDLDKHDGKVK